MKEPLIKHLAKKASVTVCFRFNYLTGIVVYTETGSEKKGKGRVSWLWTC